MLRYARRDRLRSFQQVRFWFFHSAISDANFDIDDVDNGTGDAQNLFGQIDGAWSIYDTSTNISSVTGGPGTFTIWNSADMSNAFTADLDFAQIGVVLDGGVINGMMNLTNFIYSGLNDDLDTLLAAGVGELSLGLVALGGAHSRLRKRRRASPLDHVIESRVAITRLFFYHDRASQLARIQQYRKALASQRMNLNERTVMLSWALAFLIFALIAGVFGFTGIAGAAAGIAKILFFVFLVLLIVSLIARSVRGSPPPR